LEAVLADHGRRQRLLVSTTHGMGSNNPARVARRPTTPKTTFLA